MKNLGQKKSKDLNIFGISAANLWGGAQVLYKFGDSGDFADNLLISARLLYEIEFNNSRFHLPVMGNLSAITATVDSEAGQIEQLDQAATQLLMSSTGAMVGLYPYFEILKKSVFTIVAHGVAAWKMNGFENSTGEKQYLTQGRLSLGLELGIGKTDVNADRLPLTVSIAPVLTIVSSKKYLQIFGETKNSILSLEITAIAPIGQGIGFMLEVIRAGDSHSSIRAGLVLATGSKK